MNKEIVEIKVEAKRSVAQDAEVLTGRAKSGLMLRVLEHEGGAASFDKLFEKMEFFLKNTYQDQIAPYPGQVTKSISCPAEFKPRALPAVEGATAKSKGFLLMASGREAFGACDAGSAQFQAAYFLIGCKAEGVAYEVKMFLPYGGKSAEELQRIYGRFLCEL